MLLNCLASGMRKAEILYDFLDLRTEDLRARVGDCKRTTQISDREASLWLSSQSDMDRARNCSTKGGRGPFGIADCRVNKFPCRSDEVLPSPVITAVGGC